MVIFNRLPVPEGFRGTGLYLAGSTTDEDSGTFPSPEITWWNRSHPLTRFIDWSDVGLLRSFALDRQPGARVLVDSEAGPLLQLIESDEARILTLSFALEESDWPHKVGFPVFLSQLLQWAHPEGWDFVRSPLKPGESFRLPPFLADADGWRGRMPDGTTWHLEPGTGGVFNETDSAGVYTVEHAAGDYAFAVNAGSPNASDLRSRLVLPQTADETGDAHTYHSTSLWRPLVLGVLLLLILETWLYTNKARPPVKHWSGQKGTE